MPGSPVYKTFRKWISGAEGDCDIDRGKAFLTATTRLRADASATFAGQAALGAATALIATPNATYAADAALAAHTSLSASGSLTGASGASLEASVTLHAAGDVTRGATASLRAGTTPTASGDVTRGATATLTGGTTLTASGQRTAGATASLTAGTTRNALGTRTQYGVASLSAGTTLTADATRTKYGAASLSAGASISSTGTVVSGFDKGWDFRQTATYVSDPTGCTYCIGDRYPTTRNGVTFGWSAVVGGFSNDSTTVDHRLSGTNQIQNSSPDTFRVDLPHTGNYVIRLALGDNALLRNGMLVVVKDNATGLITIPKTLTAATQYVDASGVIWTAGQWPTSNVASTVTFATTTLNVVCGTGTGGDFGPISHLRVTGA